MKKGILNLQYIVGIKNSPDRYSIYGKGSDGTWLLCQHTQVMFPGAVSYVTDESHSSLWLRKCIKKNEMQGWSDEDYYLQGGRNWHIMFSSLWSSQYIGGTCWIYLVKKGL